VGLTIIVPEIGLDPNQPRSFAGPAAFGHLIASDRGTPQPHPPFSAVRVDLQLGRHG
jgi:hypothetical protein